MTILTPDMSNEDIEKVIFQLLDEWKSKGELVNGETGAGVLLWAGGRAIYVLPSAKSSDYRFEI
jgi:hypothetical protein